MGLRLGFFNPLLAQWMITPFVLFVFLVLFFIVNQRCCNGGRKAHLYRLDIWRLVGYVDWAIIAATAYL